MIAAGRIALALVIVALAHPSLARTEPKSAKREAYEWAIKCFVADGHAQGQRKRAGDDRKAAYYEEKGHEAFDAATKLGAALGLTGGEVTEDFQRIQAVELPTMVGDDQYFLKAAATCKALGLM